MLTERRRDYFGGLLMVVIGLFGATAAHQYDMGTLTDMGPGFFPSALSILLALVGAAIAGLAAARGPEADAAIVLARPEWRGWACIIAGALLFILLADRVGLTPATFACVLVAALGDRETRPRQAAALALGITVFGFVLFSLVLKVELPALRGVWE